MLDDEISDCESRLKQDAGGKFFCKVDLMVKIDVRRNSILQLLAAIFY